jgi:hypothetical protein
MSERFFRIAGALTLVLSMSISLHAVAQGQVSPQVVQQIQAIQSVKASFTPGQQKMGSGLAFGVLAGANDPRVAGIAAITPLSGNVRVAISGTVGPDLLNAIAAAGGSVEAQNAQFGKLIATLPASALESIAARSDVLSVRTPSRAHTNAGLVTSQGYVAHGANQAGAAGWTGTGVQVGVLSDSACPATVAALITTGDLPAGTTSLPGQDGCGLGEDEGTAMMEIVHDMAPGASLLFATAFISDVQFANNIIALAAAGSKVIVDDVTYSNEGAFQDTIIAQAVNTVVANYGVTYFSSAANSGALSHNTSGTWEGDFVSGGPVGGVIAGAGETGLVHNFGSVNLPQTYNVIKAPSPFGAYDLQWSDPFGGSGNDYDFFLLNSTGTAIKGFSADSQTGTQDPIEEIYPVAASPGDQLVVVLFNGSPRALRIDTNRGQLVTATSGSTFGHNAASSAVTMAATFWGAAKNGLQLFTGGPSNPTETFSSDGPRQIFYYPNGTPITTTRSGPNVLFSTGGGTQLQKPDLSATDGGSALTPGFNPFFGTSAAAPHAAAIAALILQARPSYSTAQIVTAMKKTALDIMAPGVDRDAGSGITMALPAIQYALTH